MRYGTLKTDKRSSEQKKILSMIKGVRQYALTPVKLADGTSVWLEHYWQYYNGLCTEEENGELRYELWNADQPFGPCYLERHGNPVEVTFYDQDDENTKDIMLDTE